LIDKKFQKKNDKKKANNNHKIRTKVNIKIKLNQIIRDKIEKKKRFKIKYITIKSLRTKFDIISKEYDIYKFFTTSEKYFPPKIKGKYFPENQTKFSFNWKVFFIDQFFQ
jgi:uncharacterized protein with gpF-like domain